MKAIQRFLLRLLLLALLVLAVILGVRYLTTGKGIKSLFGFSVSRPLVAQPTPMRIQAIRSIGQWEFLSIDDEEIIDTVRRHWLSSDDQLVRIYRGTLRLGVDFRQCSPDWALAYGDTVKVRLPEVRLLDNLFIDEARVRSFYESGKWNAADRKAMLRRAEQAMRRRCLTPENMQLARQTAKDQLRHFFLSLGFANVVFEGEEEEQQPPASR